MGLGHSDTVTVNFFQSDQKLWSYSIVEVLFLKQNVILWTTTHKVFDVVQFQSPKGLLWELFYESSSPKKCSVPYSNAELFLWYYNNSHILMKCPKKAKIRIYQQFQTIFLWFFSVIICLSLSWQISVVLSWYS